MTTKKAKRTRLCEICMKRKADSEFTTCDTCYIKMRQLGKEIR